MNEYGEIWAKIHNYLWRYQGARAVFYRPLNRKMRRAQKMIEQTRWNEQPDLPNLLHEIAEELETSHAARPDDCAASLIESIRAYFPRLDDTITLEFADIEFVFDQGERSISTVSCGTSSDLEPTEVDDLILWLQAKRRQM